MLRADLLPTPEDWIAIQGGKPRIFESPTGKSYEILHVYGQQFDPSAADVDPQYGCRIPTIGENMMDSLKNPIEISFASTRLLEPSDDTAKEVVGMVELEDGWFQIPVQRVVKVPAALLIQFHGQPCSDRSYKNAGSVNNYEKIGTTDAFRDHMHKLRGQRHTEQLLGADPIHKGFA